MDGMYSNMNKFIFVVHLDAHNIIEIHDVIWFFNDIVKYKCPKMCCRCIVNRFLLFCCCFLMSLTYNILQQLQNSTEKCINGRYNNLYYISIALNWRMYRFISIYYISNATMTFVEQHYCIISSLGNVESCWAHHVFF